MGRGYLGKVPSSLKVSVGSEDIKMYMYVCLSPVRRKGVGRWVSSSQRILSVKYV